MFLVLCCGNYIRKAINLEVEPPSEFKSELLILNFSQDFFRVDIFVEKSADYECDDGEDNYVR